MKITICTGPFYPVPPAPCGAVERLWYDLGEAFARRGHEVIFLCRHFPGQRKNEIVRGVRYIRRMRLNRSSSLYFDLLQDMVFSLRLLPLLPRADVVVTNNFWLPMLLPIRKRVGAVDVNVNRWPKGQLKLYKCAARLTAVSGAIRDEIIRQQPTLADQVSVVPNPINIEVFKPSVEPRSHRVGAGTILYTGRVHPEKGVHLLVQAFAVLAAKYSELRLRVVGASSVAGGGGGDAYLDELRQFAGTAPVEIVPPIYDRQALAAELHQATIYCYPSVADQGEAFGGRAS